MKWTTENIVKVQTLLNMKYINSIVPSLGPLVLDDEYSTSPITIDNKDWLDWAEENGIINLMPENVEDYMIVWGGAGPCKSDLFVPNELAERALILGYLP